MLPFIYLMTLSFFLKASSYQCQEIPEGTEFSINVTQHITVEAGECIKIPYGYTFPNNKVTIPYKRIWFKGDPQNHVHETRIENLESESMFTFRVDGLPEGKTEYGFKLEWGDDQTYIFPERVLISVSALTPRPLFWVPTLTEGELVGLSCTANYICSGFPEIHRKLTKDNGCFQLLHGDSNPMAFPYSTLNFNPKAEDHNTNITCVAVYKDNITVEKTIILTIKSRPRVLNGSRCVVQGDLLTCVCISQGFPLPKINWPLGSVRDYTITSSGGIRTVNCTVTMSTSKYHNTSVLCISSNELGQDERELHFQYVSEDPDLTSVTERCCIINKDVVEDGSDQTKVYAALPWIIAALSLCLNFALIYLLVHTYKRMKGGKKKSPEEDSTYISLDKTDVGQEYDVISPRPR